MSIGNTRTSSSLAPCFMQLSLVEKWEKITWLRVRRRAQNTQILQRRSRPLLPSWGWEWVHRMGRLFYYLPRLYTWTYATFRLCDTLRLHSHCPHSRSHKNGASSQPFKKINQILRILKKCSPRYGTRYRTKCWRTVSFFSFLTALRRFSRLAVSTILAPDLGQKTYLVF